MVLIPSRRIVHRFGQHELCLILEAHTDIDGHLIVDCTGYEPRAAHFPLVDGLEYRRTPLFATYAQNVMVHFSSECWPL